LAVNIEACVAPAEDLLHKGKADELFPEKQREDLMGKDFLDSLVMETTDTMESTIRGRASFSHQDMDMRMEVDALSEGLDHRHNSRHELQFCGCVQKFHKCTHRAETEIIEEFSLVTEEQTQHLGNSKDNLTVGNIKEKFFPHPVAPLLPPLGMTGGTESACLTGKHEEALFPAVWTPDAGKPAHRIPTVKILLNNILDHGTEIAVLLLEPIIIFSKEPLKIIKEYPIKNRVFRMMLPVDPCHGSRDVSRNRPWNRKEP